MTHDNNPQGPQWGPQGPPPQEPKKKSKLKLALIIIGVLVLIGFCTSVTGGGEEGDTASSPATSSEEAQPAEEAQPTEDAESSTPQEALVAAIKDELGDDVTVEFVEGKDVRVNIPITSAWSESSAAKSVRYDTIEIIRLVKESEHEGGTPYLRVSANADMVDQMGNSENREVIMTSYWPETLDQINPDGVRQENIWEIADERFIHPAFQD